MKKFWLGLLSTIVLLGGSLAFTACDTPKLSIELSDTHTEICLNDDSEKVTTVVATVKGIDRGEVSVSSNYPDTAIATAEYSTVAGGNVITIKAVGKGDAEIYVTSKDDATVSSTISVSVYNRTTAISQNPDKSHAYVIKGQDNELSANLLVKKEPAQDARGDVTWKIDNEFNGFVEDGLISLNGDILTVSAEYSEPVIKLVASVEGVDDATVEIAVMEPLGIVGDLSMSYSGQGFTAIDYDKALGIVSNISNDENYIVYVKVSLPTMDAVLPPVPYIAYEKDKADKDNYKKDNDELSVRLSDTRRNVDEKTTDYIFEIKAKNHYVNNVFSVYFDLGYKDLAYSNQTKAFKVSCFEKIEKLSVIKENGQALSNENSEDIFTTYNFAFGGKYTVQFTPDIPTATKLYTIEVKYPISGRLDDLQFYLPNNFDRVHFTQDGMTFRSDKISASTLYILAGVQSPIKNVEVKFISDENEKAVCQTKFNLIPTAANLEFAGDYNVKLDSTNLNPVRFPADPNVNFTLEGEDSTNLLSIETEGDGFTARIEQNGNTTNSVNFKVVFTVNKQNASGSGRYRIVHRNGMTSQWYNVNLYVPMSDITVSINNSNGGVTKYLPISDSDSSVGNFAGLYLVGGDNSLQEITDATRTLEYLLIRSGFNVGLNFNTHNALVTRNYKFLDYDITTDLNAFDNISAGEIYRASTSSSSILTMNGDNILTSSTTGHTYLVIEFIGQDESGNSQKYVRILRIENYVAPSEFALNPNYVDVYAASSVDNVTETICEVTLTLSDIPLTYNNIQYFTFVSNNDNQRKKAEIEYQTAEGEDVYCVVWDNYKITNLRLHDTHITFTVTGLLTNGQAIFEDWLRIEYANTDKDNLSFSNTLFIRVRNADRVEKLSLESTLANNELYFRVNDNSNSVLLFSHSPTNAKNNKFDFILTDGTNLQYYLNTNQYGDEVHVSLSAGTTMGATGYLYVLPADAVNENSISYYLDGKVKDITRDKIHSHYDELMDGAYFINNKGENIYFKDFLVRIKVTVADGESEAQAYHIYSQSGLEHMEYGKWYVVMNDITLSSIWDGIQTQIKGIKGYNQDVTITMNGGKALINENRGTIKDLRFVGSVNDGGFVANVNNGTIDNVVVDVNASGTQMTASSVTGDVAGGIAGTNSGTITNVSVLGVSVSGNTVGGIVGSMLGGKIENARYEIYNFVGGANILSGTTVGGIIGEYAGGTIDSVYSYDYTMTSGTSNLQGTTVGSMVGSVALVDGVQPTLAINHSFAVVNIDKVVGDGSEVTLTDVYNSYYNETEYTSDITKTTPAKWSNAESWVNSGEEYLTVFHQDKPITDLSGYEIKENIKYGRFYQALKVSEKSALLFNYSVSALDSISMNESESSALLEFNTISLVKLLGNQSIDGIVVLSSDPSVAAVNGQSLVIKKNGNITLTLASKHDYTITQTFDFKIIYAITDISVALVENNGQIVSENSDVQLQKGKSFTLDIGFESQNLVLGNRGNEYTFITSEKYTFDITGTPNEEGNGVTIEKASDKGSAMLIANSDSVNTNVKITLNMDDDATIASVFTRSFNVVPFNGGITLNFSNEDVAVTPSRSGYVRATLVTNEREDMLTPAVRLSSNKIDLKVAKEEGSNIWTASLNGEERLRITIRQDKVVGEGTYTKTYSVIINVAESYRGLISEDEHYAISFASLSQIVRGDVDIVVSKQAFTNVDITNYKVESIYTDRNNNMVYRTQTTPTGVISPGNSSILRVNVNPSFAYYDHVAVRYDTQTEGTSTINLATIKYMQKDSELAYHEDNNVTKKGNGIEVKPADRGQDLYFKVWANTSIREDTTIIITATFYDKNNKEITHVNYFLLVSYFVEPSILIDGVLMENEEQAILAKGQDAEIKVIIPRDCEVDIDKVAPDTQAVSGVYIQRPWKEELDTLTGARIFTSRIVAGVTSHLNKRSTTEDGDVTYYDNFTVSVQITRNINGGQEPKSKTATINLVDFKIKEKEGDLADLSIEGMEGDTFTTFYGVSQNLTFNYPLLPEILSYDKSDPDSVAAVEKINKARDEFLSQGYYNNDDNKYYINYNKETGMRIPLTQNLSYQRADGTYQSISNTDGSLSSVGGLLEWSYQGGNSISVKGLALSSELIRMRLETHININGSLRTLYYFFNIVIKTFSDEDVPLMITNEDDFRELDPNYRNEGGVTTAREPQDYILMSDIVLNDYTPFDTTYIKSLDGNGYTIYINSYNAYPDEPELNYALFKNVIANTTLKNVRVNVYNGGQLIADINKYSRINVAGLAISNAGVITNCEVVSFQMQGKTSTSVTTGSGLVIKYINGQGTSTPQYLYTDEFTSNVAGFVLNNTGSITNSRVGGDSANLVGGSRTDTKGQTIGYDLESVKLEDFNIVAQGSVSGFVGQNSGTIASSFAKNIGVTNESRGTTFVTAGFVMTNTNRIATSYVQGTKGDSKTQCMGGTSIASKYGVVAGFVYQNGTNGATTGAQAKIDDSYSNILISNENNTAYLASGFVYMNYGTLTNCFSASQISKQTYSQMNFSGVDKNGKPQNYGTYNNCYYYNSGLAFNDSTTESKYETGAVKVPDFSSVDNFYGFSFNSSSRENDGVWMLDDESGLTLVEANNISFSNRYSMQDPEDEEKYILPYSTMFEGDNGISVNYGSVRNPIIIRSAEEFVGVTGNSTSSYISQYFTNRQVSGRYRLVKDIDLSTLAANEKGEIIDFPSVNMALTGRINGNAFTISGLSVASTEPTLAYGMFASIEKGGSIINVNIKIDKVENGDAAFVGGLAGYINGGIISNVDVTFGASSVVRGLNFVGGVAGFVTGQSIIKNVNVTDANIEASRKVEIGLEDDKVIEDGYVQSLRNSIYQNIGGIAIPSLTQNTVNRVKTLVDEYSYAGGLAGVIDTYLEANERAADKFNYQQDMSKVSYDVIGVRILNSVKVNAQVVGGAIGFSGLQTDVKDLGVEFNDTTASTTSSILATRYFAGGVIGQSYGNITKTYSQYSAAIQENIENSIGGYYSSSSSQDVERGSTSLFASKGEDHPVVVGGLIGYVGSGTLTISYSKINTVNMQASYAGGLIGELNSAYAPIFSVGEINEQRNLCNYLIHEAFTSGDIRANMAAGGVFGRVESGSPLLSSVNVTNFLSFNKYNEENESYSAEDFSTHSFDDIHVYAVAGEGNCDNISFRKEQFIKFTEDEEQANAELEPTVGVAKTYVSTAFGSIQLNPYKDYQWTELDSENKPKDKNEIFELPRVSNFSNAANGYEENYPVYLGKWWSSDNWVHKTGKLYPSIKLSLAEPSFIYLDHFNVTDVLEAMNQGNIEVRVRGKISPTGEGYDDIDLRGLLATNKINDYQGKIVGVRGDNRKPNGEYPALILNGPMFNNVKAGFRMQDLTIKYQANGEEGMFGGSTKYSGGFVNGDIANSSITNVKFVYAMSDGVGPITLSGEDIGLLATKITNTSIYNFDIEINGQSTNFLTASNVQNVGLIAGQAIQNSKESVMNLSNINILDTRKHDTNMPSLINVTGVNGTMVNIGSYFGSVQKDGDATDLNLYLGSIINRPDNTTTFKNLKITLAAAATNANIGGYIGYAHALDKVEHRVEGLTNENSAIIEMDVEVNNSVGTFNAGTMFGQLLQCSNVYLTNASIKGDVFGTGTMNTANIGGIAGQSSSAVTATNFTVSDFNVYSTPNDFTKSVDTLSSSYTFNNLKVTGTANIGAYVGNMSGAFTLTNNNSPTLNGGIAVEALEANVGGILGLSNQSITITGKMTVNTYISATHASNSNEFRLGGFVGQWEPAKGAMMITGAASSVIAYNGQIYTNDSSHVGGILGDLSYDTTSATGVRVKIEYTAFGGAVKVYNTDGKTIIAGGTIGAIPSEGTTLSSLTLQSNYNYGDVFVLYGDTPAKLNALTFGGIVGQLPVSKSSETTSTVENNYSLVTLNNQVPSGGDENRIHAMFGTNGSTWAGERNYYNHAVALCTDDSASDAGYMTTYEKSKDTTGGGYTSDKKGYATIDSSLAKIFKGQIGGEFKSGTKLNPALFNVQNNALQGAETSSHGITYYYLGDNKTISSDINTLENTAIIGDTFTLTYNPTGTSTGFIKTMSGQSFVSGLNLNVEMNVEMNVDNPTGANVGGLADTISSGTIYAVGVQGNMSVGGETALNVGGLAGGATKAYISESFTDIHIIYRADASGQAAAVVGSVDNKTTITYTYAVGTVECYIDVPIDGFSIGEATIQNSYTTANLEWHDYTSEKILDETNNKPTVFSGATKTDSYNDTNATGIGSQNGIHKTNWGKEDKDAPAAPISGWIENTKFNYGYPTRQFNYLKTSSYFERGDDTATDDEKTRGIHTYNYTRLTWDKQNVNYSDLYFAIPNITVWNIFMSKDTTDSGNAILRNDLYYNYGTMKTGIVAGDGSNDDIGSITLDGQGHRIYNINHCLFVILKNSIVMNLDILDASITDGRALLADEMQCCQIYNMTLSGTLANTTYKNNSVDVGALAAIAKGESADKTSKIYSLISNVKIDVIHADSSKQVHVGGVIGSLQGYSEIYYSSNNGPIVVSLGGNSWSPITVGGLVGCAKNNSTIKYSYNTASVLNGFTNPVHAHYETGGILGNADKVNIEYCYNSGMIKSGNKSLSGERAVFSGKDVSRVSYAAGIVAYAEGGKISNCINEGPVEALGKNPTWKYSGRFEKTSVNDVNPSLSVNNKLIISISSEEDRNVYAYGIGFGCDKLNNNSSTANIDNDGNVKGKYTYDLTTDAPYQEASPYKAIYIAGGWLRREPSWIERRTLVRSRSYHVPASSMVKIDSLEEADSVKEEEIIPTAYDKYDFPSSLYVKTLQIGDSSGNYNQSASDTDVSHYVKRNAYIEYVYGGETAYEQTVEQENDKLTNNGSEQYCRGVNVARDAKWLIKTTVASKKNNVIKIGGQDCLFTYDTAELKMAIDTTNTWKLTESFKLDYDEDPNCYSFVIGKQVEQEDGSIEINPRSDVKIEIDKHYKTPNRDGYVTFEINIYSIISKFDQNDYLGVSEVIKKEVNIDTSSLKYSIDLSGNITIKDVGLSNSQKQLVRGDTKKEVITYGKNYEYQANVCKAIINGTTVYLEYDNENLIYHPDAHLGTNLVNTITPSDFIKYAGKELKLIVHKSTTYSFAGTPITWNPTITGDIDTSSISWVTLSGNITVGDQKTNLGTITQSVPMCTDSGVIDLGYPSFTFNMVVNGSTSPSGTIYCGPEAASPWDLVVVNAGNVSLSYDSVDIEDKTYRIDKTQSGDYTTVTFTYTGERLTLDDVNEMSSQVSNALMVPDGLKTYITYSNSSVHEGYKRVITLSNSEPAVIYSGGTQIAKFSGMTWTDFNTLDSTFTFEGDNTALTILCQDQTKLSQVELGVNLNYTIDFSTIDNLGKGILYRKDNSGNAVAFGSYNNGIDVSWASRWTQGDNSYEGRKVVSGDTLILQFFGIKLGAESGFKNVFNDITFTYEFADKNLPNVDVPNAVIKQAVDNTDVTISLNGEYSGFQSSGSNAVILNDNRQLALDESEMAYKEYNGVKVYTGSYSYSLTPYYNVTGGSITLKKECYYEILKNNSVNKSGIGNIGTSINFTRGSETISYKLDTTICTIAAGTSNNDEKYSKEVQLGNLSGDKITNENFMLSFVDDTKNIGGSYTVTYSNANDKISVMAIEKNPNWNIINKYTYRMWYIDGTIQQWTLGDGGNAPIIYTRDGTNFFYDINVIQGTNEYVLSRAVNFANDDFTMKCDNSVYTTTRKLAVEEFSLVGRLPTLLAYQRNGDGSYKAYVRPDSIVGDEVTMSMQLSYNSEEIVTSSMPSHTPVKIEEPEVYKNTEYTKDWFIQGISNDFLSFYNQDGSAIIYQPEGKLSVTAEFTIEGTNTDYVEMKNKTSEHIDSHTYSSVILTGNISLGHVSTVWNFGNSDSKCKNLFGDNHTISFYTNGAYLFEGIADGLIKDVNFVGMVSDYEEVQRHFTKKTVYDKFQEATPYVNQIKYVIDKQWTINVKTMLAKTNAGELKNINLFGTLTVDSNLSSGNGHYSYVAAGMVLQNTGKLSNIGNYVSIAGLDQKLSYKGLDSHGQEQKFSKPYYFRKTAIISGFMAENTSKDISRLKTSGILISGDAIRGYGQKALNKKFAVSLGEVTDQDVQLYDGYGANGNDGQKGQNASDVYLGAFNSSVEITASNLTLSGYVYTGEGGNAAAGQNGQEGANIGDSDIRARMENHEPDWSYSVKSAWCLDGGSGGNAGTKGTCGKVYYYGVTNSNHEGKIQYAYDKNVKQGATAKGAAQGMIGMSGYSHLCMRGGGVGYISYSLNYNTGDIEHNSSTASPIIRNGKTYARVVWGKFKALGAQSIKQLYEQASTNIAFREFSGYVNKAA